MLDFLLQLPTRATLPQVLSISLGSLSSYSCELLCTEAVKMGQRITHYAPTPLSYRAPWLPCARHRSKSHVIYQNTACKQYLGLRCVLLSDPSTFGAGSPNQSKSRIRIKKVETLVYLFRPHPRVLPVFHAEPAPGVHVPVRRADAAHQHGFPDAGPPWRHRLRYRDLHHISVYMR